MTVFIFAACVAAGVLIHLRVMRPILGAAGIL